MVRVDSGIRKWSGVSSGFRRVSGGVMTTLNFGFVGVLCITIYLAS